MFLSLKVRVFIELFGRRFDTMVFAVFVSVGPVEGFVGFRRTTERHDHCSVDFFHHFGFCDENFVFPDGRGDQFAKDEGVFSKFGGEEPV